MFKLRSETGFDMAHYLSGYQGKCSNIHGHRYRLVVELKSETLENEGQQRGMVYDFTEFKKILKLVADNFDHKLIVEDNEEGKALAQRINEGPVEFSILFVPYRPTAEEMSRDIFNMLKNKNLPVHSVELYETPTNSCIYTEE